MAARRVKSSRSVRPEALRLRATLRANTRGTAPGDPLKVRRDTLDGELRALRSQRKTLVEAID
jgi:hypothetical protein